jgi:hypothetical protein
MIPFLVIVPLSAAIIMLFLNRSSKNMTGVIAMAAAAALA